MERSAEHIRASFEQGFLAVPLALQIDACDRYELAPLFEKHLPAHQPILEAGCGSGRWVGWFARQGWRAVGLDWSAALCDAAHAAIPEARFETGDMAAMPFADGTFGSIVALGSVEHAIAGPSATLQEFHRVLTDDGVVILTIPHASLARRWTSPFHRALARLKGSPWIRRLFGKPPVSGPDLGQLRRTAHAAWRPVFAHGPEGWFFYEYHFTMEQMRGFLDESGFTILESFAAFKEEGVLHHFGRFAGVFDHASGAARLNGAGRLLARLASVESVGLMACFVAVKKERWEGWRS